MSSSARAPALIPTSTMRPSEPGDREVGHEVVAADEVDGDVDRPRRGGDLVGQRGRVELAGGEHRVVEPEGPRTARASRRCGTVPTTVHPSGAAELHRGGAHPGPDRVHEHHLARLHRGLGDHRVVGGDEHLGHAARGDEVERVGDRRALRRRHREQLGLAAATGDAEHARADRGLGDAVAERDDLARELEAGDVGGRTGRRGVEAGALREVGAVEAGAVHAHEHLARTGFGIGAFLDPQLLVGDRRALAWRRR